MNHKSSLHCKDRDYESVWIQGGGFIGMVILEVTQATGKVCLSFTAYSDNQLVKLCVHGSQLESHLIAVLYHFAKPVGG